MTNLNLSLLALATKYRDQLVPTVNQKTETLRRIRKVMGSGPNVSWVARTDGYTGAAIGNYSEGADFTSYSADPQIALTLPWGRVADAKFVSGTALRAAQSTISPLGNETLWVDQMKAAIRNVCELIGEQVLTGSGSNEIVGLDSAIDDGGTYAGQDRGQTANAPLRAEVFDPGSPHKPVLSDIRADLSAIEKKGGYKPSQAVASFAVWDMLAAEFDQNRQYVTQLQSDGSPQNLVYAGNRLLVDGCEFVRERLQSDTEIFYFSPDEVELVFAQPENIAEIEMAGLAGEDGFGPLGIPLQFKMLPETGDSHKFAVFVECQLRVLRANACGKRLQISLT